MDTRPLANIAKSYYFKAHPDGLCISANAARTGCGRQIDCQCESRCAEFVVLCNKGCRPDTVERKLTSADAAVVGTYFRGGKLEKNGWRMCAWM